MVVDQTFYHAYWRISGLLFMVMDCLEDDATDALILDIGFSEMKGVDVNILRFWCVDICARDFIIRGVDHDQRHQF